MSRKKKITPDEKPPVTPPAEPAPESSPEPPPPTAAGFPIVGIGASAGGLAAFEAFFSGMPADTEPGMACVLVQHLAPDHKSILAELIRRYTRMEVFEVEDGMKLRVNCAYIIPPNRDMALLNGALQLLEPTAPRGMRTPIDFFFRSMAQDQHERAICIVLSGTGSDGTLGVRAVKGEGGMAIAQLPESTEHDGMPRSAMATGLVDFVLPPAEMAAQLIAYVAHAFGKRPRVATLATATTQDTLKKICVLLRAQTGHDFSNYKENTIVRRVERRMALRQVERPDDYLRYLQATPGEATALFRDLLIGVTNFFRDPEAFASLQTQVIPRLFAGKAPSDAIRVWVCGCSTGEEAYSIAILLQEHMDTLKQTHKVQVFATDVDRVAVETARDGTYPASIATDVSPERLARFFIQDPAGVYRIQKSLRDLMVFSEQDVIKDPPFSKLDLITCRNLLIYINAELQKKLILLFHYALSPGGMLFLGSSETVGEYQTHFDTVDRKWKIYLRRKDVPGGLRPAVAEVVPPFAGRRLRGRHEGEARLNMRELTERALLEQYVEAGLLVNPHGDILYIFGRTGHYLEPAPGDAALNVLHMAREGLRRELTTALHRAVTDHQPVHLTGLRVRTNGDFTTLNLTVRPVATEPGPPGLADLFLVIFETGPAVAPASPVPFELTGTEAEQRVVRLEHELRSKDDYLQSTLEEMETANEELKSTNEELQSVNEELQSTNEELETSKEELQSLNEELATVNTELQTKVAELTRANNDMNNLLAGTGVATLFVDLRLHITRFTPTMIKLINLIQTDMGRPVSHIVSNLVGYSTLVADIREVLETLTPRETEVQTTAGTWFLMHIRPYRTLDNVIEGAVITFVDITRRRRVEQIVEAQVGLLGEIIATAANVPVGLAVLDTDLRFIRINDTLATINGVPAADHIGKPLKDILPALTDQFERIAGEIARTGKALPEAEVVGETPAQPGVTRRWTESWYPLKNPEDRLVGYAVVVREKAEQ